MQWLQGKKESDQKYVLQDEHRPQKPPSPSSKKGEESLPLHLTFCRDDDGNNQEVFHPSRAPNISGMFFQLVNSGMDPYEAREVLLTIMQARDETNPPATTDEDAAYAELVRKRQVRFLDEIHGVDDESPIAVGTSNETRRPLLGPGSRYGGQRPQGYDREGAVVQDRNREEGRLLNDFQSSTTASGSMGSSRGETYGHPSLGPVTTSDPDIAGLVKTSSPCFVIGEDEDEDELGSEDLGETGRINPRSAYSQESRLLCEP